MIIMANNINATCSICGKGYHKCLSCVDKIKAEPWKQYTDTSEHYKVFQVVKGYNIGVYTKEEARDRLGRIDLSDLETFRDNIKKTVKEIMREDKKPRTPEISVEEVEAIPVAEVVEQQPHPTYTSRKKRYLEPTEDNS